MQNRLFGILSQAYEAGASDLHIKANSPAMIRILGDLVKIQGEDISANEIVDFCQKIGFSLEQFQNEQYQNELNDSTDFGFSFNGRRFRLNFYKSLGNISLAIRILKNAVPSLKELDAPSSLSQIAGKKQGLVLITGATGSGKSTTLAAIINEICLSSNSHIITIEDPVEFVFSSQKSLISQREIPKDCQSYAKGLKQAMRQDPDVIMIGEIRDAKTLEAALYAAETGHLVLSSLHANSATSAVDKAMSLAGESANTRQSIASSLLCIVYQQLLPNTSGGRSGIYEVLINSTAVANLIREGKTHQLASTIQLEAQNGCISFKDALFKAVQDGKIEYKVAQMTLENKINL